jgi:hypothetical protein
MTGIKTVEYLLVAAAVVWVATPAVAQVPAVDISDQLIVYSPYAYMPPTVVTAYEGGPNGPYLLAADSFGYWGNERVANGSMAGKPIVLLHSDGTISDIFGLGLAGGPIYYFWCLGFASDESCPLSDQDLAPFFRLGLPPTWEPTYIEEGSNGLVLDVTPYLADAYRDLGFTATFVSYSDAVPEPATLVVWSVLGAMGTAFGLRRKRKPA